MANLDQIFNAPAFDSALKAAVMAGFALVFVFAVGAIIFVLVMVTKYKNKVAIIDAERNGAVTVKRFREVPLKSELKIFAAKPNKMATPPADCFKGYGKKGKFLAVIKDGSIYTPLKVSDNPGSLEAAGDFKAIMRWYMADVKETEEVYKKKESLLLKIAPYAVIIIGVLVHLLLIILILKRVDMAIDLGRAAADNAAHAGQQLIQ